MLKFCSKSPLEPEKFLRKSYKAFFLIIICIFSSSAYSQALLDTSQFLPHRKDLEEHLRKFYTKKKEALKAEFQTKNKYKFLRFLPSLGYNFIQNTPIMIFSSSQIESYQNTKATQKAKIQSIERVNEVDFNEILNEVIQLRETLKNRIDYYNSRVKNFEIQKALFIEIIEKQYKNREIPPSEYLKQLKDFQTQLNLIEYEYFQILEAKNTILIKSKVFKWSEL